MHMEPKEHPELVFERSGALGCFISGLALLGVLMLVGGLVAIVFTEAHPAAFRTATLGAILFVGFLLYDQLLRIRLAIERRDGGELRGGSPDPPPTVPEAIASVRRSAEKSGPPKNS